MVGSDRATRSMGGTRRGLWWALVVVVALMLAPPAAAQLSPGPLSRVHADLEGLRKCSQCHKLGNRAIGPRCLDCHKEIAAMRDGGRGLHAGDGFGNCAECHVEHQGKDFELIHWDGGRDAFDHREAGYPLTGSHVGLDCRRCHTRKNLVDPAALLRGGKDLERTFLGAATDCAGCHTDPHDEQFVRDGNPRSCTDCHDTGRWTPAPLFDHTRTSFVLTGRHQQVECGKCHEPLPGAGARRFVGVAAAACTDCHQDPHANSLGADCTRCHTTEGWREIIGEGFDHARTRYPLEGRHAALGCAACHGGDRRKPTFAACRDCHGDAHQAKELDRPRLMVCEDCHTVGGFSPARFGLDQHARTPFPLRGAHPAVPCMACHEPLPAMASRELPYNRAADLAPTHDACASCHRDPHGGQTGAYFARVPEAAPDGDACLACHDESTWRGVAFDHGPTGFLLEGRHAAADCRACHRPTAGQDGELLFAGAPKQCAGCHDDVHKGMFTDELAAVESTSSCDRCHVTVDWLAEKFDHDRDSRFPLVGGHENVACQVCHAPLSADNPRLLHFKPVPTDCRACHANDPSKLGGRS